MPCSWEGNRRRASQTSVVYPLTAWGREIAPRLAPCRVCHTLHARSLPTFYSRGCSYEFTVGEEARILRQTRRQSLRTPRVRASCTGRRLHVDCINSVTRALYLSVRDRRRSVGRPYYRLPVTYTAPPPCNKSHGLAGAG